MKISNLRYAVMITYSLILSSLFPSTHSRAGEPTDFEAAFYAGQPTAKKRTFCKYMKLHTLRGNYDLWAARFKKIAAGEAVLSIRQWVGRPYGKGSRQREIARLTRDDGIGLQKLVFLHGFMPIIDDGILPTLDRLSHNDGLSLNDWSAWFTKEDLSKPLAIIHFTKFRY